MKVSGARGAVGNQIADVVQAHEHNLLDLTLILNVAGAFNNLASCPTAKTANAAAAGEFYIEENPGSPKRCLTTPPVGPLAAAANDEKRKPDQ